ncbi:dihydrodipicolinate synthase family protein, partial [Vibrio parahaemolyticus]
VPGICVKLFNAVQCKDHDTALDIHNKLNRLWNVLRHDNLPACVKYIQHRQGLGLFHPRAPMDEVSDEQKRVIDQALKDLAI